MKADINNYEVLISSGKWNVIYPKEYQIVDLTTVMEKLKDDNPKLSKSVKTAPKNQQVNGNQTQSCNRNCKNKSKGKKDRQMSPQDKWKLESHK